VLQVKNIEKIINTKIKEHGSSAEYSHIAICEKIAGTPTVGVWWYVAGRVLKYEDLPENCEPDSFICVSQEHNQTFKTLQEQYKDEIPEILNVKYNEIERGRVWLQNDEFVKGRFVITCSTEISKDPEAIRAIKNSFGLIGQRVKVESQQQYDNLDIKIK
jgi:hypothetical protein